ncbi:hypothetical protein SKAU_G00127840 [Synaphobranchus kaupii]|uniref:Uncharacterized protein n=1 Tax=Synaphobranchus kaupii TaxID=118154 RepID=A0A9Q1FQS8_SYNKA|nr:hypothetical protein SKAU_G00127840 [Synaphobranchus kaupii]
MRSPPGTPRGQSKAACRSPLSRTARKRRRIRRGTPPLSRRRADPAAPSGTGTEDSWASLGSFASAQASQHSPLDQRSQSGTEPYCSPRPGPAECTDGEWMGGRRLYQRSSSSLCTASPLSQDDGDPSLPSRLSMWAQQRESPHREEKAYPTSGPAGLGEAESSEVQLQSAWACGGQAQPNDPLTLLQELGRRGDQEDSAYYSYFH